MNRSIPLAAALLATAASLLPALPAAADPSTDRAVERADPSDPRAAVPPVPYRSPFSGYRPLSDGRIGWKQANEEVGRIGGWRSYAREAHAPEPAASAAPSAAPAKPAGHGAHGDHGTGSKQ